MLAGLKELDSKEKEDLNKKRENFTPRVEKKVEPKESNKPLVDEKQEEEGNGWTGTMVIIAALAVAGCMLVAKRTMTKS